MEFEEVKKELEALGNAQNRKVYKRHRSDKNLFGVSYVNLNKLKKKIKTDMSTITKHHARHHWQENISLKPGNIRRKKPMI